ncbi:MAG: glucuronate isomerase [bacterium]|nr:glucuronate isomerase [bacterium]MDY4159759.1 glucuronate isomerase [Candidatus Onthovivens sp.]
MKEFLGKDFMLNSDIAKVLYHEYVEKMPIYDYHCHLSAKEIYEDRRFDSITDLWLVEGHFGDHYKWRAMRANGVSEKYITGDASKKDKFLKWAETIPYTVGNPLYIWTHLELRKYFGIYENFSPKNASSIYDSMNETLKTLTARKIIENSNVDTICTTDDPIDDLRYHKLLKEDKSFKVHVYPAFRPDKLLNIDWDSFLPYIESLSNVVGYKVNNLATLKSAIKERIEFFHENGCRISDHALDKVVYEKTNDEEVDTIIQKRINGETITDSEVKKYRGYLLVLLGKEYKSHGWVQQYHIKALRNNSSRMMREIGPDTGFDSINDGTIAEPLSRILDELDSTNSLPKTILYSLNPSDNELLATLAFCFREEGVPGKMQLGSAWWFLDQKDGMINQFKALSNLGLLSRFVGMLTDSRSFLSYTRHEYFRRLLCNFVADLVNNGEYPNDIEFLGKMLQDIAFNNAKAYFDSSR